MAAEASLNGTPFGTCPVPKSRYEHVLLGHGSGGQLTAELIQRIFLPGFANDVLSALEDQATHPLPDMVARSPDRATSIDRRSPVSRQEETCGPQSGTVGRPCHNGVRLAFTTD